MPGGDRSIRSAVVAVLAAALAVPLAVVGTGAAAAQPPDGLFPDRIDAYADYDGASSCSPTDKPGATALLALIRDAYEGTGGHISRPCGSGQSEHYEGRAVDWMIRADTQRDLADDFLDWLLAEDAYGNEHANARRLGVMYIIWDREMWRAYDAEDGWEPYGGSNPHTDHMHISLSWDGALTRTSWFTDADQGRRLDQARFAATWRDAGRLDVFRRSGAGELQQRTWSATWGTWEDLGGSLTSGPAATWAGKRLWVFARGRDGTLEYRRFTRKAGWKPWASTGVEVLAAPGVTSRGDRVDLVVLRPDEQIAHRSWRPGKGWSAWQVLGGRVTAPPAAAWRSRDHLDLFVRGGNGMLYQSALVEGEWTGWVELGGFLTSGPAATSSELGRSDVYVRSSRGSVYHRSDTGSGWSGWLDLGDRHVSGPTASTRVVGRMDVFARDRTGGLRQNYYVPGSGWSGWGTR